MPLKLFEIHEQIMIALFKKITEFENTGLKSKF